MKLFKLWFLIILIVTPVTVFCLMEEPVEGQLTSKEINKMSLKKLREMLARYGLKCSNCIEKVEYAQMLITHLVDQPTGSQECMSSQTRVKSLEDEVATLKEKVFALENTVSKLKDIVALSNKNTGSNKNQKHKSSNKVDMSNGNMVNGKFYAGRSYSDETGNSIFGVGNTVTGTGNSVKGNNNQVLGNLNDIKMSNTVISGSNNRMG